MMQRFRLSLSTTVLLAACGTGPADGVDRGQPCTLQEDCRTGLVCASDLTCHDPGAAGTWDVGTPCVTSAQCQAGLACTATGSCAVQGDPGTRAAGDSCQEDGDCQYGLTCPDGTCRGLQMALWDGASCPDPALETGPFRVYFEVPRTGVDAHDFYRLPYPNDARVDDELQIDLQGHPSPGPQIEVLGDVVGNLLRLVSTDLGGGFGANQAIFFRLTAFPDAQTLSFGLPGTGTLALVDLDGPDPTATHPIGYVVDSGATPYICDDWLALYPVDGRPLEPGHHYAALLARGIRDKDGNEATPDADFTAMLGDTLPADPGLKTAWNAYRPLRDWLTTAGIDGATLAAAAVFTVQDVTRKPEIVRTAVLATPVPALEGLILCGGGSDPYAVDGDDSRGCTPADDRWYELQATVSLPQFQAGLPPFKDFVDGGGITIERGGTTSAQRFEDVHVSVAVPKGIPMPNGGWPVILYAHGTGGSYTSALRDGFADAFARVTDGAGGGEVAFAIVGFDAPLHGPRAHPENWKASWLDVDVDAYAPDALFFNPLNPRAARDNVLQEVADLTSLVQVLAAVDLSNDSSPTGEAVRFSLDRLVFAGHSQGATVGPAFLATEPMVDAALLSGAGGLTLRSLLDKTSPRALLPALRIALGDPDVDRVHPVLNLLQQLAEEADGVNHARYVLRHPFEGQVGKNVLQIYGIGDTYSPDSTQTALAKALGLLQAPQGQTPLDAVSSVDLPTAGSNVGGHTGVVVLYPAPAGSDAHFVLFEDATAQAQAGAFLATLVQHGTPTVPAP